MLLRTPGSVADGKRAQVTGAGHGTYLAAAAALAQAGPPFTLAARSQKTNRDACGRLRRRRRPVRLATVLTTDSRAVDEQLAGRAFHRPGQSTTRVRTGPSPWRSCKTRTSTRCSDST